MAVEAVIFDIGNVLTQWQPEAFYDRVIGKARRRALFEAVDLHQMIPPNAHPPRKIPWQMTPQ